MTDKLKIVLVCYEGLPEKEVDFVHKILKGFKKYETLCLEYKKLSDCEIKLVKKLTDCCNETDKNASDGDANSCQDSYPLSLQSVIRNIGYEVKEGILIGLISLDLLKTTENQEYEVGFFIRKEKLGLGFGKEALDAVAYYAKNKLEALSLIAITDKDNIEAVKLLEKCGFRGINRNNKRIFIKILKV